MTEVFDRIRLFYKGYFMQVILLEKIKNLGNLGDCVNVKPGYGRNFLIPQKKALFATDKNLAEFELKRAELEKLAKKSLTEAQKRADLLSAIVLNIVAQASEEGVLYGSVGVNELKAALLAKGCEVSRREILLTDGPFHVIGQHAFQVQVHSDVIVPMLVDLVVA